MKNKKQNLTKNDEIAILLGNGINLLTEGVTWASLLNQIAQRMYVVVEINNKKTFPMIFEKILFFNLILIHYLLGLFIF